MKTLHVAPHHLTILQSILKEHPGCYVFGSRVKGTHKRFSDLDLCFKRNEPMSFRERDMLAEAFEESDLPFTVDILDYQKLSPSFQHIIDQHSIAFPYSNA